MAQHLHLFILGIWLDWIALGIRFSKIPRSSKLEFGVKGYGVFRKVTGAVFSGLKFRGVPHSTGHNG